MMAAATHGILVVMAPLAGTMGAVLSPLVWSCRGISVADVQEPSEGEPCVERSSHSR
jgi:hypothetical protein